MDFDLIMSGFPTRLMRGFVRLAGTCLSTVCLAALRAIIAGLVFATCALVMMHYSGLQVPVLSEVLDKLESLGKLAKILS